MWLWTRYVKPFPCISILFLASLLALASVGSHSILYLISLVSGTNPCESLQCSPHQECDIDRYGIATCVCPDPCPPIVRPVCGDDEQTYDSECELKRQACLQHKQVSLAYRGSCGNLICLNVHCKYGARCEEGRCLCPVDCPETYEPVCSSQGVTVSFLRSWLCTVRNSI